LERNRGEEKESGKRKREGKEGTIMRERGREREREVRAFE